MLTKRPTGAGKTIFSANVAKEVIKGYGQKVTWISLLLEPNDIMDIFPSILRVNHDYINSGQLRYYGFEIVTVSTDG